MAIPAVARGMIAPYMFAWAGDIARQGNVFLATI
jgi:hypothetical protein